MTSAKYKAFAFREIAYTFLDEKKSLFLYTDTGNKYYTNLEAISDVIAQTEGFNLYFIYALRSSTEMLSSPLEVYISNILPFSFSFL